MEMVCYNKCGTCRKAKKFLEENNVEFTYREITEDTLSFDELKEVYKNSNLPIKRLLNTSGKVYRDLKLKDKVGEMEDDEVLRLLSENPMLIKRPVLRFNDKALIGFKEEIWKSEICL